MVKQEKNVYRLTLKDKDGFYSTHFNYEVKKLEKLFREWHIIGYMVDCNGNKAFFNFFARKITISVGPAYKTMTVYL